MSNIKTESENLIEVEIVKSIAWITLTRGRKLNALNSEMVSLFTNELKALENNTDVRGIIITGKDKSFIVGADISEMKNLDTDSSINFISHLHNLINTIRTLNKPVIAAVNGYCYGAGLELAVACDLVITSEEATFGMQEVKIGMPSVIEAALFPFVIGLNKTRELLLTGDVIEAKEALNIGLVNHVVSHSSLEETAIIFTEKIIVNPAHSIKLQKQLINRWLENAGVNQSIKNGIDYFGISFSYPTTNNLLKDALK